MDSPQENKVDSNKIQNSEIPVKSKKKLYIILGILLVLIALPSIFFISRKNNNENQTIVQNVPSVKPEQNTTSKDKPISSDKSKSLVPVSLEFAEDDISSNSVQNNESITNTVTPIISGEAVQPTSTTTSSKTVNLNYLFSVYMQTAEITNQANINQFGIGGLDNNGEKYLIGTYYTPADRNADAVFTNNGDKVAFQENDGLYVYVFSTKEKIKIAEPLIRNYGKWNNDGSKLAYLQEINGKRQWNIYNFNNKTTQTIPTIFEKDSSNFEWMPVGNGFAYNSQVTFKVYLSNNDELNEIPSFNCQSNLMFSQDGRYLICTNSYWIRMYDVQTGTTTKWDDPKKDWYYNYQSPIWINASYKTADPLLFVYTTKNKLHITSKKRFFDSTKPESKEVVFNTSMNNIMFAPGFGIYNIRYINDNQAISEGTIDGDHDSLILIEGFANLSYENPNLTIKYLDKNKGFATHGFSVGSVSREVKY